MQHSSFFLHEYCKLNMNFMAVKGWWAVDVLKFACTFNKVIWCVFHQMCHLCPWRGVGGGDKVSLWTHTYPHNPPRKIKVTICSHQADNPLYVWSDVWSGDLQVRNKYHHTWHQMSFLRQGVTKQHKPNPYSF